MKRAAPVLAVLVLALGGPAVRAQGAPASTVAAFCAAHPDRDNPGPAFYGSRYMAGKVPPAVAAAGANAWRCMAGRVLICRVGADGRPCARLSGGLAPAPPIRAYCAANPGSDFVPMVVIGDSASTWRCRGATPAPLETESLDERGFIRKNWRLLALP